MSKKYFSWINPAKFLFWLKSAETDEQKILLLDQSSKNTFWTQNRRCWLDKSISSGSIQQKYFFASSFDLFEQESIFSGFIQKEYFFLFRNRRFRGFQKTIFAGLIQQNYFCSKLEFWCNEKYFCWMNPAKICFFPLLAFSLIKVFFLD